MQSIKVELGEKNQARLEVKRYESDYTNVPNSVLPEALRTNLGVIYEALSGQPLPEDSHTFTVKSEQGKYKRLYKPSLVKSATTETLCVRWGEAELGLEVEKGKLKPTSSNAKVRFSFRDEKISDKLTLTYFVVSVVGADRVLYTMDLSVIPADFKNPVRSEVLEVLLDDDPAAIATSIGTLGEGGERLQGPIIKAAFLPLGTYSVVGYRSYENEKYGTQYSLQIFVPEDKKFEAPVNRKNDNDEWEAVQTPIEGFAQVKSNTYLKKFLGAAPIITEEKPAQLTVVDHGEWNGHPTAEVELVCAEYEEDEGALALSF